VLGPSSRNLTPETGERVYTVKRRRCEKRIPVNETVWSDRNQEIYARTYDAEPPIEAHVSRANGSTAAAAMSALLEGGRAVVARPLKPGGPIFLGSDDPGELARERPRLGLRAA
jgi:hypothetical protein